MTVTKDQLTKQAEIFIESSKKIKALLNKSPSADNILNDDFIHAYDGAWHEMNEAMKELKALQKIFKEQPANL